MDKIMMEDEKLIQENANLAVISKLINSSLNKTVQDTITSMFGELKENDAILVAKKVPLICERIGVILKNQEDAKTALDKREDDHENRLRTLESRQMWWAGASMIVGAIGGYLLQHIIR